MRLLPLALLLLISSALGCASSPRGSEGEPPSPDVLIPEMERVFAETPGMIDHTHTVLGYAMDIHLEEGGEPAVVRASAILHDVGIPRAREVHGSSGGPYQEVEGPPIAREILTRYGFPPAQIDLVCGIVANHHSDQDPRVVTKIEFQILWDADWLVNFPGRHRDATIDEKALAIEGIFKTERGKELAREMFLESSAT